MPKNKIYILRNMKFLWSCFGDYCLLWPIKLEQLNTFKVLMQRPLGNFSISVQAEQLSESLHERINGMLHRARRAANAFLHAGMTWFLEVHGIWHLHDLIFLFNFQGGCCAVAFNS